MGFVRRFGASVCFTAAALLASEYHGQVRFGGLPVPGATVTAVQNDKRFATVTDEQGAYSFPNLPDGTWTIQVEMQGFSSIRQDVDIGPNTSAAEWNVRMLGLDEIHARVESSPAAAPTPPNLDSRPRNQKNRPPVPTNTQTPFQRPGLNASSAAPASPSADAGDTFGNTSAADLSQRASDGLLINGSANNGASSPFGQAAAFGNNRRGVGSLYTGNIGLIYDTSVLDARAFSLTGQNTPKPDYQNLTGVLALGGPFRIPHLIRNGPNFAIDYQWNRSRNANNLTGLMPTAAERAGDLPGLQLPASSISPQAQALLDLYPLPNFTGSSRYNYQIAAPVVTHQDNLQTRANKAFRKNQFFGNFALQSIRSDTPNIFEFTDTTRQLGINTGVNWRHAFTPRFAIILGDTFSRQSNRLTPYFENRQNTSALAGIFGNAQDPMNWGPPTLNFTGGITPLTDGIASFNRNLTNGVNLSSFWNHGAHNITSGADYRKQQFNYLAQNNPRGTFTFTGAASGSDFADFLLGIPDAGSIAFGNADKYFRDSNYDAYITDDWRVNSSLTLNVGVRWEYWSPITELYSRLVNLDIAPGFTAAVPVLATNPVGALTGQSYPDSLVHPDKHAFQPRIGVSWRPFGASSVVVRAGYGVYYNTSVYQTVANQMAQQPPFSKTLSVQNSTSDPLTLAQGFNAAPPSVANTFAIDPNFRIGYAQNWQASIQRDLPGSLVAILTYQGAKGTRGVQEFLPNTYPIGAVNPCPSCPSGFYYMTSNGNSTREAGVLEVRRRLHNGLTATMQYTVSKSIDDAALGGKGQGTPLIAQNWLDLGAERSLSNFYQRQLVNLQTQYSTGTGVAGGTLLNGWRGTLFKEWTVTSALTYGTGLPLTPVYPAVVNGTGVSGPIRPEYTGVPLYATPPGLFLNPAAFVAPPSGEWGNAGRNSITGPAQFTLNGSLQRIFRLSDRLNFELRFDGTNILNHVNFTAWNTTITSAQFGLPAGVNAMRSMLTTFRLRF